VIRVGFLGAGNISRRHFGALERLRDQAEIVAVCDAVEERARAAAAPCGARVYLSANEMLARERLDALYICLPPDAHVDQELIAAERGIHLFVEKPLPLDLAKAECIARAIQAGDVISAVGFHWRHFSHAQRLREMLRGERVGLVVGSFMTALGGASWWRVKARSGGQVVEQAIHIVDASRFLLGEVEQVWADYALRANGDEPGFDQEDVYTVNLRFASGVLATYAACCILHRRYQVGLDIMCKGRAYRLRERTLEIDDADGVRTLALENEPGFDETAVFMHAIRTGDRSGILSDYADALRTQRVVIAANRSAATGAPVRIG
jgi:predicted dehydrogenase